MPSRIRYGLLISITIIGLFLTSFVTAYAGSMNYIYDELGRLYQVVDPQGNVTTYNYDSAGNRLSITRGTAQEIVNVNPRPGITNVALNTLIAVLFTNPVDRTTISSASFTLMESNTATPVQGTFSFDFDDKMVIFAPQSILKPNTSYILNITTSVKSADGVPLDQAFSGPFITAGAIDTVSPTVTTIPVDQATDVPVNTNVVFIFSEPMNPTSLNSSTIVVTNNGMPVSGNITLNPINTVATFVPFSSFLPNSLVNVSLSSRVTDIAGNHIVGSGGVGTDFVSGFSTGSSSDTIPPQILSIDPPNGGTITNPAGAVSVTFSEPINPATVNGGTFILSVNGAEVSGQISFSNQNTVATFTPDEPLPDLAWVDVYLAAGISDMAGNTISLPFASTFRVPSGPMLNIGYSGPTTLTVGDTNNITVSNTGEMGTSLTYNVTLSDNNGIAIYQNAIADTIEMGSSKNYAFQIPNQGAGGDYSLYAEVTDNRGKKTTGTFNIKITGLSATLNTKTNKDVYSPTESITATTSLSNGPFGIENGSLKVSVTQISQSTAGQFTQFLPKKTDLTGLLSYPGGVAVAADGSVYVADSDNNRIQKFDASGNSIMKWGSEGSGDGQFSWPWSVAVGPDGSIYVADTGNNRIQKFDSSGNFITKWGTEGSGDGQFGYPIGVSVGSDGPVYVVDLNNNRIQKFDGSGDFITKWGTEGSGDGQFEYPYGIAIGSDGSVYVADSGNYRIQKFDSSGVFITKWGTYCITDTNGDDVPEQPCNGQFNYPEAVAVGPDGSIYVTDDNHRVQKFDSGGNFITQWGSFCDVDSNGDGTPDQPCDGQFYYPYGIAVSLNGLVYVADSYNNRIEKFDGNGNFITKWGSIEDGQLNLPQGVALGLDGSIYVADTNNHRIQKFDKSGTFITKWGTQGQGDGQFNTPRGIAVGPDGSVYVVDTYNYCIQKFGSNGNFITKWGTQGDQAGQFVEPYGIAIGPDGSVYVSDIWIQKFDNSGNFISYILLENYFGSISGIATSPDGSVYVAGMGRVKKADSNGSLITSWEISFSSEGNTDVVPCGISVGPDGSVYVTNTINHPIQKFDSNGNLIAEFASYGSDDGQFSKPRGIAVAQDGSIYVADKDNNRIQRMTTGGTVQTVFETTLPINQSGGTTQDYTTNIGTLSVVGNLSLQATLTNSLGQTISQANYPFSISNDTTPPTGTITINSGASFSNNANVTLTVSCTDGSGCAQMQFSNDNITYSAAEVYATTKTWTLSAGDGTKTVYVKFKDATGNWSTAYSNTILLDTTAPTTTASPVGGSYNTAQSVNLSCNDESGSGCDKIYYTTDGTTPTPSSSVYSSPINISVTTTLQYFATDKVGNSEAVKSQTYTISTNMVTVELKDSTGAPLSGGVVQYYSGGWQAFGTTDASGRVSKELQPGTYTFSMNYAFARQEKSQNVATNPTVVFQTINATVQLKDSTGTLMDTGTVQYYSGGWRDIGSTSGGQVSKELLPGSYTFSMNYSFARQEKAQNIASNPTVVFQTTNVAVQLKDSTGSLMDTGTVQYYSGGWRDIGSTSGGQVSKELLPGSYTFSMNYAFARQEKAQNVASNPTVVFQTISATVQLKDSTGALMDTGTVQYYSGGWRDIGSTSGGQVSKELLSGTYTFRMTYGFANHDKSQNTATNPTVVFQTINALVQLKDSTGALIDTGTVQYYSGGWRDIGSTSGGQVTKELLPGSYTFSMNYAFARQEKAQNIATNPTVVFQTTNATVQLKDSTGALMDTGTVQYYSGGWHDIGSTSGGQVNKELLPGSYTFSMSYAFARQEKSQNITSDPTVVFQTGQVRSDSGTCTNYYAIGWRMFTQNMELLPLAYTFRFNDGTQDTPYTIIGSTVNHIH